MERVNGHAALAGGGHFAPAAAAAVALGAAWRAIEELKLLRKEMGLAK
jgi:hypothetical protein